MPRIAIVYDRLTTEFGGAEVVLDCLMQLYPDAALFTSVYAQKAIQRFTGRSIRSSFLQKIPFIHKSKLLIGLLSPLAFESLNFDDFDIIISVTSSFAKGILTKPQQLHVCYMLTPTRFLHSHKIEYQQANKLTKFPFFDTVSKILGRYLTKWDVTAALRPDYIIPISKLVANRSLTFYKQRALSPIYPPTALILSKQEVQKLPVIKQDYFLIVSRLVAYKKISLSIAACLKINATLVIAGEGEELASLIKLAGKQGLVRTESSEDLLEFLKKGRLLQKNILFIKKASHREAWTLMKNMRALLMPAQEDFGITALEAAFFGKPSIVHAQSGVSELLQHKKHAIFITKLTITKLQTAMEVVRQMQFSASKIKQVAQEHTSEVFIKEFADTVSELWQKKK